MRNDKSYKISGQNRAYHTLDHELKEQFGKKIYKLALDGGMTCPNRDGTLGYDGCIFCSHGGSGDFAEPYGACGGVWQQIERAKVKVSAKIKAAGGYIAYFQSYTNTYQSVDYLERLFGTAIGHPDVVGLSVGTRPDCLPQDVIDMLGKLNGSKPVWVELGLQTIHEETAELIRRGYGMPCFYDAYSRLKRAGLTVVVHVILGLPGETKRMMYETVDALAKLSVDGIKLQLLHVLRGTELGKMYEEQPFPVFTLEEYIDTVIDCVSILPADTVIHRISGDGPKSLLMAPLWSGNKRLVLNTMIRRFMERGVRQGEGILMPDGTVRN